MRMTKLGIEWAALTVHVDGSETALIKASARFGVVHLRPDGELIQFPVTADESKTIHAYHVAANEFGLLATR